MSVRRPVSRVLVVGGGTAGWLAASYLQRALGSSIEVALVESQRIGVIGVGEGTANTFPHTMAFLGLDERDWMPRCNATYKLGIKYNGWNRPESDGSASSYFHCFYDRPDPLHGPWDKPLFSFHTKGFSLVYYWLKRWLQDRAEPFSAYCGPHDEMAQRNAAPHPLAGASARDPSLTYGYHVDASAVGGVLRELSLQRGVKHHYGDVVSAELDEQGFITAVSTEQGQRFEADLFIDCTGFRRALIGKTLEEPFIDYSKHLLCDAAVAIRRDHDLDKRGVRNHTVATALDAGWAWQIPLYHREGCGYVYSSDSIDRDQAERELRSHIGVTEDEHEALHLRMRIGRNRNSWVRNCVSIGLSSAFVEPLEASTIVFMEFALYNLVAQFPHRDFDPGRIERWNGVISQAYDDIRDFIVLHYILSDRSDTDFWRRVQSDTEVPTSLSDKMQQMRDGVVMPSEIGLSPFALRSWACVMSGMRFDYSAWPPILDHVPEDFVDEVLQSSLASSRAVASSMPEHLDYLRQLHACAPRRGESRSLVSDGAMGESD